MLPTPEELADVVASTVRAAVAPLLARIELLERREAVVVHGRDGMPGRDGMQGPAGPQGERGEKGDKGEAGERGEKGLEGFDGKDGASGTKGEPGDQGAPGEKGADGLHGKDGAPGLNGKDGKDGITFTAKDITRREYVEADRLVRLTFGDLEPLDVPCYTPSYLGVWTEGKAYGAGDCVTWGGSMWIAREDTTAKPGLPTPESRTWVLAVKRGADGKKGGP